MLCGHEHRRNVLVAFQILKAGPPCFNESMDKQRDAIVRPSRTAATSMKKQIKILRPKFGLLSKQKPTNIVDVENIGSNTCPVMDIDCGKKTTGMRNWIAKLSSIPMTDHRKWPIKVIWGLC